MCVCSGVISSMCKGLEIDIFSKEEDAVFANHHRLRCSVQIATECSQVKLSSTNSSPLGLADSSIPSPLTPCLFLSGTCFKIKHPELQERKNNKKRSQQLDCLKSGLARCRRGIQIAISPRLGMTWHRPCGSAL